MDYLNANEYKQGDQICPLLTMPSGKVYPCQKGGCALYRGSQRQCGLAAPFPVMMEKPGPTDVEVNRAVDRIASYIRNTRWARVSPTDMNEIRQMIKEEIG